MNRKILPSFHMLVVLVGLVLDGLRLFSLTSFQDANTALKVKLANLQKLALTVLLPISEIHPYQISYVMLFKRFSRQNQNDLKHHGENKTLSIGGKAMKFVLSSLFFF